MAIDYTIDYSELENNINSLTWDEVINTLHELTAQLLIELEAGKKTKAARARARKLTNLIGKVGKAYRALSIKE